MDICPADDAHHPTEERPYLYRYLELPFSNFI